MVTGSDTGINQVAKGKIELFVGYLNIGNQKLNGITTNKVTAHL